MDLQTESIYKEEMVEDPKRFMPLFEESYSGLYRFVARRIEDDIIREQIVRITVLDAIGQMSTCPKDVNFLTWLYKIAQGRVAEYAKKAIGGMAGPIESPIFDGASVSEGVYDDEYKLKQQAEGYFAALNYEEKEIVRLKFFEELTDGEVMYVMDFSAGSVGAKIYQVLKRSYEVLFGKVDEYAGVYYGELYSFLSRLKDIEKIPAPEVFKLKLKAEVINKLDKMYEDKFGEKESSAEQAEAQTDDGEEIKKEEDWGEATINPFDVGSKDPAKAFVYAAKGMSKEEVDEITREYVEGRTGVAAEPEKRKSEWQKPEEIWAEKFGQTVQKPFAEQPSAPDLDIESGASQVAEDVVEHIPVQYQTNDEYADEMYDTFVDKFYNFWERWRAAFQVALTALIALTIVFVTVVWFVEGSGPVPADTLVEFAVNYKDGFTKDSKDEAMRLAIEKDLIVKIAEGKQIYSADVSRQDGTLNINFKIENDGNLHYVFDVKGDNLFRVRSYKKE